MPRKGENIYKRKDGRWEGRYIKERSSRKVIYGYVYGKTYRETRERLSRLRIEWEGRQERQEPAIKRDTFENVCALWMADTEASLKESTAVKYKNLLRCYILPALGAKEMGEITTDDVLSLSGSLLANGGSRHQGLSSKTVSDVISLLKIIRKYALLRRYPVNFSPECVTVRQSQGQMRVLSVDEEQKLYRYLESDHNPGSLGILLCLFTGIRLGELCALKWEDISIPDRKMQICKTMQRIHDASSDVNLSKEKTKIIITAPKSGCSVRTIPLPENIMIHLEKHYIPGAFLLTGKTDKFMEPRGMERKFKKVLESCGIEHANFHALRHTFATRCVEVGFDLKSLSEILGHANVNITLNRYVHPTMDQKRKNMDRLSALFAVK